MTARLLIMPILLSALMLVSAGVAQPPIEVDTIIQTPASINDTIWYRIPENYSPANPPALLVWWHAWGGDHREMPDYTNFADLANARGWIAAGFQGSHHRHWNTDTSQYLCKVMLDTIMASYPFSRDSIYMVGSSMGSAAGQVWHNNNCGKDDYIIAATAGGSQIMDCELRQLQYFQSEILNESMFWQFGGRPYDSDSVLFNYHRASAVSVIGLPYDTLRLDTTFSMHFNSLLLPVYNTWGANDAERFAYGNIAHAWEPLRLGWAPTIVVESDISDHGLWCMHAEQIIPWLAQFSARRSPDTLSISSDSDTLWYYWTKPVRDSAYVFGRYGVNRDRERDSLDVRLIRHVQELRIDVSGLEFQSVDTIFVTARNYDSAVLNPRLILGPVHSPFTTVSAVRSESGPINWEWVSDTTRSIQFVLSADTAYQVILIELGVDPSPAPLPNDITIRAVYPNPFNADVSIGIESDITTSTSFDLFNIHGRLAKSIPLELHPGAQTYHLQASGLSTGIYFASLRNASAKPVKLMLLK